MSESSENPVLKLDLKFGDDKVEIEVEFRFSENADDFFDVAHFVNAATQMFINGIKPEE